VRLELASGFSIVVLPTNGPHAYAGIAIDDKYAYFFAQTLPVDPDAGAPSMSSIYRVAK